MYCLNKPSSARGFSLIEIGIVLTVAGVLLLGALKFVVPLYQTAKRLETNEKLRVIVEALEVYAIKNNRIPCPGDPRETPLGGEPYGTERFSGANGDVIPPNCGPGTNTVRDNFNGIVPYRTLGLDASVIRDSWGRYITYSISPAFALDTSDENIRVHPVCRTLDWYYPKDDLTTLVHRNPRKARFCCVSQGVAGTNNIYNFNTDINVQSRPTGTVINSLAAPGPRRSNGDGNPDTCTDCEAYAPTAEPFSLTPNMAVPNTDISTGIAFVLVSHGPNGFGAFNASGAQINAMSGGNDEDENADFPNDRTFMERSDISESTNRYDDIVVWRTQDLMFAEQGESCVKP